MKVSVLRPADSNARVYQFGVRITKECTEKLTEQFMLAHNTYNQIIAEIRTTATEAIDWLEKKAGKEASQLRGRITELNDEYDSAKAADNREKLREVAEERRTLWRKWYELMHAVRREHGAELKSLFLERMRERKECSIYQIRCQAVKEGLGWATGNAVLKAAIQAYRKQWPKFKLPNFRRLAEVPRRTLELQFTKSGGIGVADVLAGGNPEISINNARAGRRAYGGFRMRIGSGGSRADITGTVYFHRPLPEEGRIKYARLIEHRIGKDRRHYVQFVVTDLDGGDEAIIAERLPLASLDFGWYYEEDGRRIAGFADSGEPSKARVLHLPPAIEALFARSERKKSERDKLRDEIVAALKAVDFQNAPEPLADELAKIKRLPPQYIASSRLARLAFNFRQNAPGYYTPFSERLEEWRKKDKLLWQAESHLASRARNLRKKHYENLALQWARRYEAIVIDTPDLSETAKVKDKKTGRHNKLGGVARGGRVKAALYELQQAIVNAAARFDTKVATIQGRTSKTCSLCGGRTATENAADREVKCESCGMLLDREKNAAAVAWQEAIKQMEAISAGFEEGRQKRMEMAENRKSKKLARQTARWRARTGSGQEKPEDSRNI